MTENQINNLRKKLLERKRDRINEIYNSGGRISFESDVEGDVMDWNKHDEEELIKIINQIDPNHFKNIKEKENSDIKIFCPKCGNKFSYIKENNGQIKGMLGGVLGGATLGSKVGIAMGPLGAIAGTIPGAILGGYLGNDFGKKMDKICCPNCKTEFDLKI